MTVSRRELLAVPGIALAAGAVGPRAVFAKPVASSPVTFDTFSLKIYGKRVYHWSGEFHYWRLPSPGLWRDVLQKYKAAGFTAASVYFHWGFHSSAPGKYDFTGVRDVAQMFEIAIEVGISIVARPGPYINAETDSGGFPGWLDTQQGIARTSAPDYLAASLEWLSAINPIIARYQIQHGGPVILYQVENEYTYGQHDVTYMRELEAKARADGITVPLFHNDASPNGNWAPGTPGGVNLYGFDAYPQGFNASAPEQWRSVPDFSYVRGRGAALNPLFLAEGQGGSFDPWGGPGFDKCRELTNANFNRVFYKNNIASGLTMQSFYMLFGGTSWGWLPSEDLYTSYDYGAAITEGRQLTDKYDEDKKIGYFVAAVTAILVTEPLPDVASSNPNVRVRAQANPLTLTQFFTILHKDTTSTSVEQLTFPLSVNDGDYQTVPQQGTITLNGRDAKLLVAGYTFERQRLVYSTSEIMTHAGLGARDVAILYGRAGEGGETVLRYAAMPTVTVLAGTVGSAYDPTTSDLRLNYVHQGLAVVLVHGGPAPLLLLIADDAAAATFWRFDVAGEAVLVRGPALVRSVSLTGNTIALTGDTAAATPLEVLSRQAGGGVLVTWNGRPVATARTRTGGLLGALAGPAAYVPPVLRGWRAKFETPEREAGFDDSGWIAATKTTTNNPQKQPAGQVVLYADEYGFHHGDTWYRARFVAAGTETGIALSAITGRPGSFFAWLNGTSLGQYEVGLKNPGGTATFAFPPGVLVAGQANVLSVLVENLGHQEDFSSNDSHKQPRGLTGYALAGSSAALAWKIQGTLGGENPVDTVRTPYNNGGLYGERAGWHLPGYPDQAWTPVSLPASQPMPGVSWVRTTVMLHVPANQDVSFALAITDDPSRDYRARIFVNGWHMGVYINKVGPQTQFVIPNGILQTNGENTIAIAVLSGADGTGGLGAVSLVVLGNVAGGVPVPTVASPGYKRALYTH